MTGTALLSLAIKPKTKADQEDSATVSACSSLKTRQSKPMPTRRDSSVALPEPVEDDRGD
jgi:hypothetical protein